MLICHNAKLEPVAPESHRGDLEAYSGDDTPGDRFEKGDSHDEIIAPHASAACVFQSFIAVGDLPAGFVYIDEVIPDIELEIRYCTGDNFMGRRVEGYEKPRGT